MTLARVAAEMDTLEHYIWSTLPPAKELTGGKCPVPHFDYKAAVDRRIREELPNLASKTTFLFFGFYPSNFAFFPMLKPLIVVSRVECSASHTEITTADKSDIASSPG